MTTASTDDFIGYLSTRGFTEDAIQSLLQAELPETAQLSAGWRVQVIRHTGTWSDLVEIKIEHQCDSILGAPSTTDQVAAFTEEIQQMVDAIRLFVAEELPKLDAMARLLDYPLVQSDDKKED